MAAHIIAPIEIPIKIILDLKKSVALLFDIKFFFELF